MNAICWEAASSPGKYLCVHTSVNIDGEGGCELSYTNPRATHMRDGFVFEPPGVTLTRVTLLTAVSAAADLNTNPAGRINITVPLALHTNIQRTLANIVSFASAKRRTRGTEKRWAHHPHPCKRLNN